MSVRDLKTISQKGWVRTSALICVLPLLLIGTFAFVNHFAMASTSCDGSGGTGPECEEIELGPCEDYPEIDFGIEYATAYVEYAGEVTTGNLSATSISACADGGVPDAPYDFDDTSIEHGRVVMEYFECRDGTAYYIRKTYTITLSAEHEWEPEWPSAMPSTSTSYTLKVIPSVTPPSLPSEISDPPEITAPSEITVGTVTIKPITPTITITGNDWVPVWDTFSITVTVTDQDGLPVAGEEVTISGDYDPEGGTPTGTTDAQGKATISITSIKNPKASSKLTATVCSASEEHTFDTITVGVPDPEELFLCFDNESHTITLPCAGTADGTWPEGAQVEFSSTNLEYIGQNVANPSDFNFYMKPEFRSSAEGDASVTFSFGNGDMSEETTEITILGLDELKLVVNEGETQYDASAIAPGDTVQILVKTSLSDEFTSVADAELDKYNCTTQFMASSDNATLLAVSGWDSVSDAGFWTAPTSSQLNKYDTMLVTLGVVDSEVSTECNLFNIVAGVRDFTVENPESPSYTTDASGIMPRVEDYVRFKAIGYPSSIPEHGKLEWDFGDLEPNPDGSGSQRILMDQTFFDNQERSFTASFTLKHDGRTLSSSSITLNLTEAIVVAGPTSNPPNSNCETLRSDHAESGFESVGLTTDSLGGKASTLLASIPKGKVAFIGAHASWLSFGLLGDQIPCNYQSVNATAIRNARESILSTDGYFREYEFVYISGCNTAAGPNLENAFATSTYMGWDDKLKIIHADSFNVKFFNNIFTMDIGSASADAYDRATTPGIELIYSQTGDTPPNIVVHGNSYMYLEDY